MYDYNHAYRSLRSSRGLGVSNHDRYHTVQGLQHPELEKTSSRCFVLDTVQVKAVRQPLQLRMNYDALLGPDHVEAKQVFQLLDLHVMHLAGSKEAYPAKQVLHCLELRVMDHAGSKEAY
ncbi:e1.3 [Ichnoviriform fugitivi]|uniref:E1.3 n=1 Tax=Ichnoviriform fugitivi TaxID=265522 RepID=A2Q0N8_9VIRU|nr:e1.3 [Ichnoviriform fugitivi]BAF45753.1 e1.3 [Ichnoviriform fugitivi]